MKKSLFVLSFILALVSIEVLLAQGGGAPGNTGPPSPPGVGNVDDISIISFLWILALAGAYLGLKKAN